MTDKEDLSEVAANMTERLMRETGADGVATILFFKKSNDKCETLLSMAGAFPQEAAQIAFSVIKRTQEEQNGPMTPRN